MLVVINFFAQILPPCFWQDAIEDDEVKRLKTAAYAQKAQYQAKVKELPKPNAQDELEDGWELTFMFGQRDERTEG